MSSIFTLLRDRSRSLPFFAGRRRRWSSSLPFFAGLLHCRSSLVWDPPPSSLRDPPLSVLSISSVPIQFCDRFLPDSVDRFQFTSLSACIRRRCGSGGAPMESARARRRVCFTGVEKGSRGWGWIRLLFTESIPVSGSRVSARPPSVSRLLVQVHLLGYWIRSDTEFCS